MEQNRKKLYTVGIDIGGTNTVFGIVDEQGHILSHDGIKTKDYPDINVYADTVAGHLRSLIEAATSTQSALERHGPPGTHASGTPDPPCHTDQ